MSASVYVSYLIDADNQHSTRAHIGSSGLIASVELDAPGSAVIQGNPDALRNLAAALIAAADKGDDLTKQAAALVEVSA